jgi:hypothetical protein
MVSVFSLRAAARSGVEFFVSTGTMPGAPAVVPPGSLSLKKTGLKDYHLPAASSSRAFRVREHLRIPF